MDPIESGPKVMPVSDYHRRLEEFLHPIDPQVQVAASLVKRSLIKYYGNVYTKGKLAGLHLRQHEVLKETPAHSSLQYTHARQTSSGFIFDKI